MTTQNSQAVEAANIRVVEKTNCFVVHEGNEVAGSFTGPESKEHAEMFAEALRAELTSPQVAAAHVGEPDDLEKIIDHYVDNYEMIGEDEQGQEGCYSPNDHEKHLLKDAIMGMLADPDWDAAWGEHITALAASRVPVASVAEPEHWDKLRKLGWRQHDCKVCGESWGAMSEPESPPMAVGAGGSVGAIPFVGFVARHADRSKTDTTTSVAVDASREQIQDHLAVADSRRVQASNSRVYTDAQLAAGVEALGICRGMGIPLSDETVAGVVYDYMTAAGPKRPLTIYMDEDPIDVEQFYRSKGFERMPATPTMTGAEIRDCGWKKQYERQMFIDHGNTGIPFEPIGTTQAVILMDGMRFVSIPPATWGGGR